MLLSLALGGNYDRVDPTGLDKFSQDTWRANQSAGTLISRLHGNDQCVEFWRYDGVIETNFRWQYWSAYVCLLIGSAMI